MNSIGIPYGSPGRPTSAGDLRVRLILFAVWLACLVGGLVYAARYSLTNPYVDEWLFMPVVLGDEPAGPWLWELHNEHRFPLPRLVYIGLFRATGDLRAGCLVSLLGMSLVAAALMHLARRLRGRASLSDAVFPLLLMHVGQGENLYMGYQLAFMLTAGLAAALLAVIVTAPSPSPGASGSAVFRSAITAQVLGWALLTCGAAGLAYGVVAAAWSMFLAAFGRMRWWRRLVLAGLIPATPAYIVFYMRGYHRPGHHPPSAGVYESARVGLEAQAMALGPAASGLWPAIAVVILLVAVLVTAQLVWWFFRSHMDPRAVGLLLLLGAAAAVAFGVGWGRSGFIDERGQNMDMGFAWRYGWLTAPAIWVAYFTWLLGRGRVPTYGPAVLAAVAALLFPVNEVSGFLDGETKVRPADAALEADVRAGPTIDELMRKHFATYPTEWQPRVAESLRVMHDRGYTYYQSLRVEDP